MRLSSVMGTDNVVAMSDQSTTQPLPGDRQKLEGRTEEAWRTNSRVYTVLCGGYSKDPNGVQLPWRS